MHQALAWSKAVNESVADIVQGGLPPFPWVRECLEKAGDTADMMVCSQTPGEALIREWDEQDMSRYVFSINGQEMGKKAEHIQYASEGRYDKAKILMIGDAKRRSQGRPCQRRLVLPDQPRRRRRILEATA